MNADTIEELPVNDHALAQTGSHMNVSAKIQEARDRAKAARDLAKKADEEIEAFSKNRKDETRKHDRRALLLGRALLARSVTDRAFWGDVWPDLVASLNQSSDDDRKLFGLSPLPKTDTEAGSQAAAAVAKGKPPAEPAKPENKDQGKGTEGKDEPPTEPAHPGDPHANG